MFSGQRAVVVVNGRHDFVAHPSVGAGPETYLAGSYRDSDLPSQIRIERISNLFGHFVLLRHLPGAHTLSITTDRFGMHPFYSAHHAGRLYLSSSLTALAERGVIRGDVDIAALSDILAFNVPLDQRTPWQGATGFAGGSEVTVNLDTLEQKTRRLWNPVELLRNADISFDSVKDQLVELFLQGVEQAIAGQGNVAVTLSGGADSRCLLAAALRAKRNVFTYSTGVPGSRAIAYAGRMAELCGVPHRSQPLNGEFVERFPTLLRQSILLMEGMSFSSEVEASWLRDHVAAGDVLLHGGFAELFKIKEMHTFPVNFQTARLSGPARSEALWKRFSTQHSLRRDAFCADYRERIGEQARQHLKEKTSRYPEDLDPAGVLQMLYIDEFLGKVTKYSRLAWNRRIPVYFPFAYPPLIDLILRVRTKDKISNQFVTYLLRKTHRTLARFPDSNTGAPIGASYLRRELIHVFDWTMRRLFRRKWSADHQDFADWLSRMKPGIEEVFAALQSATGMFDMDRVKILAGRCRAGDELSAWTLNFLWAWGLWRTRKGGT
jgi:asparagine synthase (glutamine-hydrolysing)